jgi:8-oxo-dGTP pyrophosphatase MutT (NUDIX family)
MSDDKILFNNRWLQVRERDVITPTGERVPYTFTRDGGGHAVAILPYSLHFDDVSFLLREEIVPPWDATQKTLCTFTGMVDPGEVPLEAACRELLEESGYRVASKHMRPLGQMRNSKATDTVIHAYAVDMRHCTQEAALGDGSPLEALASMTWLSFSELRKVDDMALWALIGRGEFLSLW